MVTLSGLNRIRSEREARGVERTPLASEITAEDEIRSLFMLGDDGGIEKRWLFVSSDAGHKPR